MKYSKQEVIQFVTEEDVKFIRLAFCDVFGRQKNISVMPEELSRAFEYGIAIDASAIPGFGGGVRSELLLHPDSDTLTILQWRPEHGRVVRMLCSITYPDGTPFERDTRNLLRQAVARAESSGVSFSFGSVQEFYLFTRDDNGRPTKEPHDQAGYMDISPDDRGENIRREICLTLEQMGISPESSHHEEGPGQNEIGFRFGDPVAAADNAITFRNIVTTVADRNGLYADFSPKPLPDKPGNGFHVSLSASCEDGADLTGRMIAGILQRAEEMTAFLNPSEASYKRLGGYKTPKYVSWSEENRTQLIRVPAATEKYRRIELRSPDPSANPYLVYALMIHAALDGIENRMAPPEPAEMNMHEADEQTLSKYKTLPQSLEMARLAALSSEFIRKHIPEAALTAYCVR